MRVTLIRTPLALKADLKEWKQAKPVTIAIERS